MLPVSAPLETSPDDFAARFAAYAAHGELYPQPEGSPLMEFVAGGLPLYLFDRTGPYTALPGPAWVVVHGVLEHLEAVPAGSPEVHSLDVSKLAGVGQVVAVESRRSVVVEAHIPLVLAGFTPLPSLQVGDWVAFETQAPLHGFLVRRG